MVRGCVLFAPGLPTSASHSVAGSTQTLFGDTPNDVPTATDAAKSIAEAVSHEAGHNLGLQHDGFSGGSYYSGHGSGATGRPGGYPALVDDDWIWGGSIDQIYATIEHGIRNSDDKSRQSMMPRFGVDGLLTGAQVAAVTDYVLSLSGKAKATPEGAKIFEEQCVACHKAGGKGDQELGAPNLSDGIWLYGGSRDAIYRSIFYARNGSMPAWSGRLDEATMKMLTVYVHALGGDR